MSDPGHSHHPGREQSAAPLSHADPATTDSSPGGAGAKHHHPHGARALDFSKAPFIVIWEVTQACDLACVHCRASAQGARHPEELGLADGQRLMDAVQELGAPVFVMTGSDPLKRPDIFDLISYATEVGLHPSLSPSGTPFLNRANIRRAADCGVGTISISIDSPDAAAHDAFRGVPGSFELSVEAAREVRDAGVLLQINTTITTHNIDRLAQLADLVSALGASRWEVFFLVPTGRGAELTQAEAERYEQVACWLAAESEGRPFHLTVVEGQFYRRVVLEQLAATAGVQPLAVLEESRTGYGRFLPGMNSGNGFVFISHLGEIYPSGFLPVAAGNVRDDSLAQVYRTNPMFLDLRDPARLGGKCGRCPFAAVCGGSRARAFATTGDWLAADPFCTYTPAT